MHINKIHISTKIHPKLRKQIEKIAEAEGVSISETIRQLLREGVNTIKKEAEFRSAPNTKSIKLR